MKNEIKVSVIGIETYPSVEGKHNTKVTVALDDNSDITAELTMHDTAILNNQIENSVVVCVGEKLVARIGNAFAEKPYQVKKSVSRDYKYKNLRDSSYVAGLRGENLAMSWEGEITKEYKTANKYFLANLAEWGLTLEMIYAMSNLAIETLMAIRENTVEDDGSNDDADEENVALTVDYNFDEEDKQDDELIDEAEVAEEKVIAAEESETPIETVVTVTAENAVAKFEVGKKISSGTYQRRICLYNNRRKAHPQLFDGNG